MPFQQLPGAAGVALYVLFGIPLQQFDDEQAPLQDRLPLILQIGQKTVQVLQQIADEVVEAGIVVRFFRVHGRPGAPTAHLFLLKIRGKTIQPIVQGNDLFMAVEKGRTDVMAEAGALAGTEGAEELDEADVVHGDVGVLGRLFEPAEIVGLSACWRVGKSVTKIIITFIMITNIIITFVTIMKITIASPGKGHYPGCRLT